MTYQLGQVTNADIQQAIRQAPKVLQTAATFTTKAAAIAPQAVPVIRQLIPLLPYGPRLSPLAAVISSNVSTILNKAPSFAPSLQQAMDLLEKAPETARQIAEITGSMAAVIQKVGEDPALDPFVDRLLQIINLYQQKESRSTGLPASMSTTKGIGLKWIIPWMDRGIVVMKHKWIAGVAPLAVLGMVGAIGYGLGRRSR